MPRVTLGFPTYDRPAYLAEALSSCLEQTYDDYEVLVVDNGSGPETAEVLDRFDCARLRVVRFDANQGLMRAYSALAEHASGELVAQLGDDDICPADRLERTVAVFDRYPDTGVCHGDAVIIDARGAVCGRWPTRQFSRAELVRMLFRGPNHVISPSATVARRVYEECGTYDPDLPIAGDLDFWLRAARRHSFRHIPGGPAIRLRRHEGNVSHESRLGAELEQVAIAVERALEQWPLREVVPEVDWDVLPAATAERRAFTILAAAFHGRGMSSLAGEMERRAAARPSERRVASNRTGRIVLTSFGFDDPGGGTIVPRSSAKMLAARGWEVTVFHAAVGTLERAEPYAVREWEDDGVRCVGVFNRPHALLDLGHPHRELDDPPIARAFARVLEEAEPGVVHFHNLHNLGLSLVDETASRGIRSVYTPHNFWALCARNHFVRERGELCQGPADQGRACASCVGSRDVAGYERRLAEIRTRLLAKVDTILPVSETVRDVLVGAGYDPAALRVMRLGAPAAADLWERVGRDRAPGRAGAELTVGFIGTLAAHKGSHLLVRAAQLVDGVRVQLHGEVPNDDALARVRADDARGVVEVCGAYSSAQLPAILAGIDVAVLPSLVWETAGLTVLEALAARVPAIVTRMGGLAEGIVDGVDGLAIDRDVSSLADALRRLVAEPDLLPCLQGGIVPPRTFARYVDDLETVYAGGEPATAEPRPLPIAVRWTGDQHAVSSLATINREVASRLVGCAALRVERSALDGEAGDQPLQRPADVEVRHAWPPDFAARGVGRLALIQPWEFGSLPRAWREPLTGTVDEVWVPSEYVRRMYLDAGVEPDRVHVVPNGVDLDVFTPGGARRSLGDGLNLLFVGGTIYRKGVDVLLDAYLQAFTGDDDVTLTIKDVGVGTFYQGMNLGDRIRALTADPAAPRIRYLDEDLDTGELAALYRGADVLVCPYRGEGFAMAVLEAMACGVPAIVTEGGPTDEFCPADASWRVPAVRRACANTGLETIDEAWMLEPDGAGLAAILRALAADRAGIVERGARSAAAAQAYGWDAVAGAYADRIAALARRPPRVATRPHAPFPLPDARGLNVLATPAWRGRDELASLLAAWAAAFARDDDACLYLLADPLSDGGPADWERHVLDAVAAAGVDLGSLADVSVLDHAATDDDLVRIHAAVDAYVPIHAACGGHRRLAHTVVALDSDALRALALRAAA